MAQAQREPRSASEAWQVARNYEKLLRIEQRGKRLFQPDNDNAGSATTGYVACVYLNEAGEPTRRFQIGKPFRQGEADHTARGGGPYLVDLDAGTCQCPSFVGTPGKVMDDGRVLPPREGEGECKHHYGMVFWLANAEYELTPIKGVSGRMRVKWLSCPDVG